LFILQASPGFKRKAAQQKASQRAITSAKDNFQMLEGLRKQRRNVTIFAMKQLFAPMADTIVRKHRHSGLRRV
jgi:hypothetical protein